MNLPLTIALVAGEVSGDALGAQLIRDLKTCGVKARFIGIGGKQMIAEGLESFYPMETLSVMGLVEVLKHLKPLIAIRNGLIDQFKTQAVDLFIGIDAPDFNLNVARQIKDQHLKIKTVQYVSPSVWAWRQKRVVNIRYAVDLVLCLFPFEVEFYTRHQVPARFVGHPLAQQMSLEPNMATAKQQLDLVCDQHYLAVLPGSRRGEINRLLPRMLDALYRLHAAKPDMRFLIPAANPMCYDLIQHHLHRFGQCHAQVVQHIQVIEQRHNQPALGRTVMEASDAVLLASGTATLEALLLHRPMVMVYRLHWLTYQIVRRIIRIPYYALPNILAQQQIVTELVQYRMTAHAMSQAVLDIWHTQAAQLQEKQLKQLHLQLRQQGHQYNAATALLSVFYPTFNIKPNSERLAD